MVFKELSSTNLLNSTQMKNQDPMKPMDSSQMLSQQAQFTQISELQKLNKSFANTLNTSAAFTAAEWWNTATK
jgi:flagellar hook assembly protein FlgD